MRIVELLINELDKLSGFDAVALVEEPAIEADFYAFKGDDLQDIITLELIKHSFEDQIKKVSQGKLDDIREDMSMIKKEGETLSFTGKDTKHNFALNVDEQVVVGPLMIPDKLILRLDSENNPYYVYFSQATVKAIANKMMKSKLLDRMNIEHNADEIIDGYMMESWIISDSANDKSNSYGFDLPEGTWMGMYKVENRSVWDLVKQQKLKGFSIEGFFSDKLIQSKKQS